MINKSDLRRTGKKRSLTIGGFLQEFDIYSIPLDQLTYNLLNGRIASYISEYNDDHDTLPENAEESNAIIENFIVESNPTTFTKTKNNIRIFSQIEPAVVLEDGTVVDGNRRFTALRQLARNGDGQQFGYLEAAIISSDEYSTKQIKILELNLQHAKDNPVEYNPIERLVDIYRDLIEKPVLFTPEEYAREADMDVKTLLDEVAISQLMIEYLDFINQPNKYYFARDQRLVDSLRTIHSVLKSKNVTDENVDEVKYWLFSSIVSTDGVGAVRSKFRALKRVVDNRQLLETALEESEDYVDELNDYFLDDANKETISHSKILNVPVELQQSINESVEEFIELAKLTDAKIEPIKLLKSSNLKLDSIDAESVARMDTQSKVEFQTYLTQSKSKLEALEKLVLDGAETGE